MSVRVYRYGLLAPTENAVMVRDQLSAAHRYRNTLVEIERGRREAQRALDREQLDLAPYQSAVDVAETELSEALLAVKDARAATRTRSDTEEQRARVKAARQIRREAVAGWREKRAALRADQVLTAARETIDGLAHDLRISARAHCGAYWGTYLLIEDADMAARKVPLYDGTEPSDPRFSRWDGDGQIGVQLQGGMTPDEAHSGSDTRLRIAAVDESAWYAESRGERRRKAHTTLQLRVGSEGRAPVWAVWPMTMHRPLPENSRIKRANVSVRRRGPREEWSVEITVDMAEPARATCGEGAVGVDLGWRLFGEEIRAARWVGTNGADGEMRLPARVVGAFGKVESLRSIRDKAFNAARDQLTASLTGLVLPGWFATATRSIGQWRSPGRLAALATRWRAVRFDGDVAAYDALETWRYHDHHLWAWESNQALSVARRRKDLYRVFAADLAKRYGVLVLEKFDLREVAKRAPTETDKGENEKARHSRQIAAVSELRIALRQAFAARGGVVEEVPAEDTSRICHHCGSVERYDQAAHVHHACSACGVVWDQDENAARVMVERWRDAKSVGTARTPKIVESRWARAARMAAEKTARKETARKAGENAAE